MCGIVGLHLRSPDLHPHLGELLTGMLCEMQDRGADSAGVAVYGDPRWSPRGHVAVSFVPDPSSLSLSTGVEVDALAAEGVNPPPPRLAQSGSWRSAARASRCSGHRQPGA